MVALVLKVFLALYLLLIATPTLAQNAPPASIRLTTETPSVYVGDVIIIDIESTGLVAPLDVSALKQNRTYLRESTGTRIAVIQGKVVEIAIRRMEFIPDQEGQLIFGPLSGLDNSKTVRSNTVVISVNPSIDSAWQPGPDELQVKVSYSKLSPMLGEEVVVDIRLQHIYPVLNDDIDLPEFNDFNVLPVFEKRITVTDDDTGWRQQAWRYLIYPKRSGELIIDGVRWSGEMTRSRTQRGRFQLQTNATVLNVGAAPAEHTDWWLAASNVKLSDAWSKDVTSITAGDEVLRTITLSATGVMGSHLPQIEPLASRAISATLINTKRSHQLINNTAIAKAEFTFRMTALSPIPVFLDTVRIRWWDTHSGSMRESVIPARRINVGLPDRADLLKELALRETRWNRLQYQLQGLVAWQPVLILLAAIAMLATAFPYILKMLAAIRLRLQRRQWLTKLYTANKNKNWQRLYQLLKHNQTETDTLQITRNASYQQLHEVLTKALFATPAQEPDTNDMEQLIQQLEFNQAEIKDAVLLSPL